ncbi:hypothetical protein LCGC14_1937080, partial [marine sediment metagenome]
MARREATMPKRQSTQKRRKKRKPAKGKRNSGAEPLCKDQHTEARKWTVLSKAADFVQAMVEEQREEPPVMNLYALPNNERPVKLEERWPHIPAEKREEHNERKCLKWELQKRRSPEAADAVVSAYWQGARTQTMHLDRLGETDRAALAKCIEAMAEAGAPERYETARTEAVIIVDAALGKDAEQARAAGDEELDRRFKARPSDEDGKDQGKTEKPVLVVLDFKARSINLGEGKPVNLGDPSLCLLSMVYMHQKTRGDENSGRLPCSSQVGGQTAQKARKALVKDFTHAGHSPGDVKRVLVTREQADKRKGYVIPASVDILHAPSMGEVPLVPSRSGDPAGMAEARQDESCESRESKA